MDELLTNWTPLAKQALSLAQKEADRFNHNFVGTEHLLLGIIGLGKANAIKVLEMVDIDTTNVQKEVERNISRGPDQRMIGNIPNTPRTEKVLKLAAKESKLLGHRDTGTEHLLLGIMGAGEGVAARVLREMGLTDIEKVRIQIRKEYDPNFQAKEVTPKSDPALPKKTGESPFMMPFLMRSVRDPSDGIYRNVQTAVPMGLAEVIASAANRDHVVVESKLLEILHCRAIERKAIEGLKRGIEKQF